MGVPFTFIVALGGYGFLGLLGTYLGVVISTMIIAMGLTKLTLKEDVKHGAIIGLIIGLIGAPDPILIILGIIEYGLMGVIGSVIGHWGYQTIWGEKPTDLKN